MIFTKNSKAKDQEYSTLSPTIPNSGLFSTRSSAHIFDHGNCDTIYVSRPFLKYCISFAGFFGALAVMMGAYGAHVLNQRQDVSNYHKQVFHTGNLYHFFHTLALLAAPFSHRPKMVSTLFILGLLLFSGSCYVTAITGCPQVGMLAPYGGFSFLLGWLTLAL